MTGTELRGLAVWRQVALVIVTVLAAGAAGCGLAFTVAIADIRPVLYAAVAVTLMLIVGLHLAEPARDVEDSEIDDEVRL